MRRLLQSTKEQRAYSWAGDSVAYVESSPETESDIYVLSLRDLSSRRLVGTPGEDTAPAFSKDGHWIAYQSAQSGRIEVWVQRYPSGEDRQQITNGGGNRPIWHPNGRQLIFKKGRSVMSTTLTFTPALHADVPVELFQMPGLLYDILPDGRFLMLRPGSPPPPVTELEVVVNWFEELRNKMGERRER